MGHCYEFGTTIVGSCDHAMTVSPEGGACVCPSCGAHCEGRFAGCTSILVQPGYVPAIAPPWAAKRIDPPRSVVHELTGRRADVAFPGNTDDPDAQVPDGETIVEHSLVEIVRGEFESVRGEMRATVERELRERDGELVKVLGRVADAFTGLADGLAADSRDRHALADKVTCLTSRVSELESSFAAPLPRKPIVVGGTVTPGRARTEVAADGAQHAFVVHASNEPAVDRSMSD